MDEGHQISYLALEADTPVVSSTGTAIGTVHHVLQIPELDLFDGITVNTQHGLRFVDRDQISEIRTTVVRCTLTDDAVSSLPAPDGNPALEPDLSDDGDSSFTARLGRLFGRSHWNDSSK